MACLEIWETPAALKQNARARRVAQLLTDLENARAAVSAEADQERLRELMKEQTALEDALLEELLHGTPKLVENLAVHD